MRPAFLPRAAGHEEAAAVLRLRRIVVLADLSDASAAALDRAAAIAAAHDATLRVLPLGDARAGAPGDDPMPRLRWRVRRVARRHGLPIAVDDAPRAWRDTLHGPLRDACLVVTHPRPARGPAAAWRGDAAAGLVSRLPQPLLVVRAPCRPYAAALAAVDLDDQPDRVARWACALAGAAPVTLLHVVSVPGLGTAGRTDAVPGVTRLAQTVVERHAALRRVAVALAAGGARVRPALALGRDVVDEVLAREAGAGGGLVAVGRANGSPWLDGLFGSVPRALLRASRHDLLVVPVRADLRCAEPVAGAWTDPARRDGTDG